MKTISLKLPNDLLLALEKDVEERGVSKSAVIREHLERGLRTRRAHRPPTCLDLMGELFGSQPGPADASTNKRYLKRFGRERTAAR